MKNNFKTKVICSSSNRHAPIKPIKNDTTATAIIIFGLSNEGISSYILRSLASKPLLISAYLLLSFMSIFEF